MRLGIIAPEFPPTTGGMQNHALGLSRELSRHCEVTVFTRTEPTPEGDGLRLRPILDNDIHEDVKKLRTHKADAWLVLTAGYADFARHTDLPTFVYCHGNDFLNPWVLQDTIPEILAAAWARTPILWRAEELRHTMVRPVRRAAIRRGLRHTTHAFTNSEYTKDILVSRFPELAGRLTISYPGIDELFFSPLSPARGRTPGESPPLNILTIARLQSRSRKKNIDGCLRALARITDDLDFTYTVVGDGDDRQRLEKLCFDLGLQGRVRFAGSVEHHKIPAILDQADLFLLASNSQGLDIETFGIVYAEAAARGVPSLLSRGGATDAVADRVNGIIVDAPTPEEIAKGLIWFARERSKFNRDSIRAFATRFRWPVIGEAVWSIIAQSVSCRAPRTGRRPPRQ